MVVIYSTTYTAEVGILSRIDPLLGAAYLKGCSSLIITLLLREGIAHSRQDGSGDHVVIVDANKAFDTIWD